jgi:valyl-tRNA synthetase
VYVHALVRDEHGKKMSKSKGNVIDPLNIIDQYGTDAFRFTLAAFAAQGRDVKMSEKRVEGYRHFVNKLWNAARFSLMHLDESHADMSGQTFSLPDRWILSRLSRVTDAVAEALNQYRFNDAASVVYQFVWHELCDWYLETIKPTLYGKKGEENKQTTLTVLWRVFHDTLILLHPFMPFVTEEIWHKFPGTDASIMKAVYPSDAAAEREALKRDSKTEGAMTEIMDIITAIRNIRGEMNISPSQPLAAVLQSPDKATRSMIKQHQDIILDLAKLHTLATESPGDKPKASATAIVGDATIFVSLEGIVDFENEELRLEKEIAKLSKELSAVSNKLNNESFLSKAPAEIVEKVREKHDTLQEKKTRMHSNLERIRTYI